MKKSRTATAWKLDRVHFDHLEVKCQAGVKTDVKVCEGEGEAWKVEVEAPGGARVRVRMKVKVEVKVEVKA